MYHYYDTARSNLIGHVRLGEEKWGWEWTPKLAAAFANRTPFVTPCAADPYVAIFSGGYIQWVQHPGGPSEMDGLTLLERAKDNVITPDFVWELLKLAAQSTNARVRGPAGRLVEENPKITVKSGIHTTKNNDIDKGQRITVKLGATRSHPVRDVHLYLHSNNGAAYRPGNKSLPISQWDGNERPKKHLYIIRIEQWP